MSKHQTGAKVKTKAVSPCPKGMGTVIRNGSDAPLLWTDDQSYAKGFFFTWGKGSGEETQSSSYAPTKYFLETGFEIKW